MTNSTTYNILRRGITALALVCISVITYAQSNVAKIEETEYTTLQAAIAAAEAGQTITLIADITETATYTINKEVAIDLGTYTITASHNDASSVDATKVFDITASGRLSITGTTGGVRDATVSGIFYNQGSLSINGGVYATTVDDYGVVVNDGGACVVTGGTLTGAYAGIYTKGTNTVTVSGGSVKGASLGIQANAGAMLNVTGGTIAATNLAKKYPGIQLKGTGTSATISGGTISGFNGIVVLENSALTVSGTANISGKNIAITGNGDSHGTTITINGGTITNNDDVAIYHPQNGTLNIHGGTITGTTALEVRAGIVTIDGGTLTATGNPYSCNPNGNGTTTVGAALAIAQHTTKKDITVNISGGTFTGVKAISESNPQENDPAPQVTMPVTGGTFNGEITTADVHNFISGGTFDRAVAEENCAAGYIPTDDGEGHYGVKVGSYVAKIGETKYESMADAIAAAPTATNTTIEILADNITENFDVPADKVIALSVGAHTISGTITCEGVLKISDGTFIHKPNAEWIAVGKEVVKGADDKYFVVDANTAEAKIVTIIDEVENTTLYQTIDYAIAAAVAAGTETTITLLKDVAVETVTIPAEANITLVLNEVVLSKAIDNNGTLNIADGTYTGAITNSGTLNISGSAVLYSKPNSYTCATGYDLMVDNDGHYIVAEESAAEAQIGTDKYLSIKKAISVAGTAETIITLLKDPTSLAEEEVIVIPADANITLLIANEVTLTKAISVSGTLTISSGTTTGTLMLRTATATITIADAVTHKGVSVDEIHLDGYVLKTETGVGSKTYRAEKRFSIMVGGGITDKSQRTAAEAMIANEQLKNNIKGLGENQSIAITVTSVVLTDGNVTSATFSVVLSGADGQAITTSSEDITFRLPVSAGIAAGKWVNLTNNGAAIAGTTVNENHYVEVTSKNFPDFSYEILATEPVAKIGETKYESVAAAIEAATSAQTIELLADISEDISIAGDKTITLAGGEYAVSGAITNSGALTLANGTFSGAITSTAGTITIHGGAFSSSITSNGGTIAIDGGTFASTCSFIETADGISISGGTFDNLPAVEVCATGYVPVKNEASKYNMTNDWKMTDATAITSIDYYAALGYTVATATYTRNTGMIAAGGSQDGTVFGTICLPFTLTAKPAGVIALYKATAITSAELTIKELIDSDYPIATGTPLIFELSATAKTMVIASTNATINTATAPATEPAAGNLLVGTYTEQNYTSGLGNKYYLNGDMFHQAVSSLRVPAYRAYIKYSAPAPNPAPERLSIVKADNPVMTQLEKATIEEATIVAVYDLQGRNIGRLQSGINIVRMSNGQTIKVIKK